jgi:hypothetical protein
MRWESLRKKFWATKKNCINRKGEKKEKGEKKKI